MNKLRAFVVFCGLVLTSTGCDGPPAPPGAFKLFDQAVTTTVLLDDADGGWTYAIVTSASLETIEAFADKHIDPEWKLIDSPDGNKKEYRRGDDSFSIDVSAALVGAAPDRVSGWRIAYQYLPNFYSED